MLNIYSSIALCLGLMQCQWTTSMYTCDIYQYQFKIHLSFMHADHLDEVKHLDSAKWQDFQTSGTFCGSMQAQFKYESALIINCMKSRCLSEINIRVNLHFYGHPHFYFHKYQYPARLRWRHIVCIATTIQQEIF